MFFEGFKDIFRTSLELGIYAMWVILEDIMMNLFCVLKSCCLVLLVLKLDD